MASRVSKESKKLDFTKRQIPRLSFDYGVSCTVPNGGLSPALAFRMYSKGAALPLFNGEFDEDGNRNPLRPMPTIFPTDPSECRRIAADLINNQRDKIVAEKKQQQAAAAAEEAVRLEKEKQDYRDFLAYKQMKQTSLPFDDKE